MEKYNLFMLQINCVYNDMRSFQPDLLKKLNNYDKN